MLRAICQMFNYKVNILWAMCNCVHTKTIFTFCLVLNLHFSHTGVKCSVATKLEAEVQTPDQRNKVTATSLHHIMCSLQKS